MQKVHLLWHTHTFSDGREDDKLIGVYDSHAAAVAARGRVGEQPGFVDNPEGFEISEYTVNKDHWQEGYVTVD
jgi:homoserine kinase type II